MGVVSGCSLEVYLFASIHLGQRLVNACEKLFLLQYLISG